VFIAVAVRAGEGAEIYLTHQLKLDSHERVARQYESAACLLKVIRKAIAEADSV
jgi:hypothetical protein